MKVEAVVIPDSWVVSFKRRRSGRLRNVIVEAPDVPEASRVAARYMASARDGEGWREYGISRRKEMHYTVRCYSTRGIFDETRSGGPELWRPVVRQTMVN